MERKNKSENEEQLIKEYKALILDVENNEEELKSVDSRGIKLIMEESNQLFHRIKTPKVLPLDCKLTKKVSDIVNGQAHNMTTNIINFSSEVYIQRVLQKVKGEPDSKMRRADLLKFGGLVKVMFQRSPALIFLYGSLSSQPRPDEGKEARSRAVRQRDTGALKETCAKVVGKDNATAEEGTEVLCRRVFGSLCSHYKDQGRRPLDYFQFIVDPKSFSKTIENMFHVSFLVNPGLFF